MSRWADRTQRQDAGFTLLEITLAMTLFLFVAVASLPLLISGLRDGRTSQLNLQAKSLGQERLERMRNLPFHVARQNGQYIDLLDYYFRDAVPGAGALSTSPPDICSARNYDSTSKTYTCTITSLGSEYSGPAQWKQVVAAQFMTPDRAVVTPRSDYTNLVDGSDAPPSNLLYVVITTEWQQNGKTRSYVLRSQIANAAEGATLIRTNVKASALALASTTPDARILHFEGGLVNMGGDLTTGSSAALNVVPARAAFQSGDSVGTGLTISAPPEATGTSPEDLDGDQLQSCEVVCFGPWAVTGNQKASVVGGLPRISDVGAPVTSTLSRGTTDDTKFGFKYNNTPAAQLDSAVMGLTGPMVSAGGSGPTGVVTGTGYVNGAGSGTTAVLASASVSMPKLSLFPTSFASAGVVQVTLTSATITCSSGSGSGAVSASWSGVVTYKTPTGTQDVTFSSDATQNQQLPDPATTEVAPGIKLSRYVKSWDALTSPAALVESQTRTAKGDTAGVLDIVTANTRAGDDTSAISIAVAPMSCLAEDNR